MPFHPRTSNPPRNQPNTLIFTLINLVRRSETEGDLTKRRFPVVSELNKILLSSSFSTMRGPLTSHYLGKKPQQIGCCKKRFVRAQQQSPSFLSSSSINKRQEKETTSTRKHKNLRSNNLMTLLRDAFPLIEIVVRLRLPLPLLGNGFCWKSAFGRSEAAGVVIGGGEGEAGVGLVEDSDGIDEDDVGSIQAVDARLHERFELLGELRRHCCLFSVARGVRNGGVSS